MWLTVGDSSSSLTELKLDIGIPVTKRRALLGDGKCCPTLRFLENKYVFCIPKQTPYVRRLT